MKHAYHCYGIQLKYVNYELMTHILEFQVQQLIITAHYVSLHTFLRLIFIKLMYRFVVFPWLIILDSSLILSH